jgi:uncharacterized membrane protein YeaQ/YmgE (transglycosylase-associated protein family)
MHLSTESLLIILLVGLLAGWLAGQIVQGTGFGIIGDIVIGIIGAFIGSWLLPQLGIHLGVGILSAITNATIGALLLLLAIRLVRGGADRDGVGEEVGADVGSAALGPWMRAPKGNSLSEQRAVSVWIAITAALAVVGVIALYLSLSRQY